MSAIHVDQEPKFNAAHMEFEEKPADYAQELGAPQQDFVIDTQVEKRIKYTETHVSEILVAMLIVFAGGRLMPGCSRYSV